MIKTGRDISSQVAYLVLLHKIAPCLLPLVYGSWDGGYAMELLDQYEQNENLGEWPLLVEQVLETSLWIREPVVWYGMSWQTEMRRTLGFSAPDWSFENEPLCAVHGDPTLSNTLTRFGQIVLADPATPSRVPQIAVTDQARILQSMMGWDLVTGHQTLHVSWQMPRFVLTEDQLQVKKLNFWVHVMMSRIEKSPHVTSAERAWACHLRYETGVHI